MTSLNLEQTTARVAFWVGVSSPIAWLRSRSRARADGQRATPRLQRSRRRAPVALRCAGCCVVDDLLGGAWLCSVAAAQRLASATDDLAEEVVPRGERLGVVSRLSDRAELRLDQAASTASRSHGCRSRSCTENHSGTLRLSRRRLPLLLRARSSGLGGPDRAGRDCPFGTEAAIRWPAPRASAPPRRFLLPRGVGACCAAATARRPTTA
jgi:hypothetical protein